MELEFNPPRQKRSGKAGNLKPGKTDLISSKYSVRHLDHFNEVTQAMIEDQKVNPVGLADQEHMVAFSRLMIRMIPTCADYLYDVIGKTYRKGNQFTIHPPGKEKQVKLSVEFMRQLVDWMAVVVLKDNTTIEDILDEYFAVFPLASRKRTKPIASINNRNH